MRRFALALTLVVLPHAASAQQRDTTLNQRGLPVSVAQTMVDVYNANATLRVSGPLDVPANQEITGDVAVLDGPVTIAGHVTGQLLAINATITLAPTARVDGDILVVGGELNGRDGAYVGGEIRIYQEALRYTRDGNRIVVVAPDTTDDSWWRLLEPGRATSTSKIQVASAGAYNRVEGLPINLGPQIARQFDGWSARLDAYAVLRTASSFRASDNEIGHNIHGEVRVGSGHGVLVGGSAYDLVSPVESWGLNNLETGLAAALFRRDYRDYYRRLGGNVDVGVFVGPNSTLTVSYADEHWSPRADQNAWTLFRSNTDWRPNPTLDDARVRRANATLTIDTRSDITNPWSGWYVLADAEYGVAHMEALGPMSFTRQYAADGITRYDRAFMDLRRYNRVSRNSQLNVRVVAGGWLAGDPLPMERRLTVDGYDALPGFGFGNSGAGAGAATCGVGIAPVGAPAQCDRIALAQAEYRSDLHVNLFNWDTDNWLGPHFSADGAWVMFVDAGRGWLAAPGQGAMVYSGATLPPLSSFRTDVGVGLDFDHFGVYVAKALSDAGAPVRLFVRLQHRF